ncbi:MAG: MaoC family dehydratase N-terminal domain-containing protein [Hyphomicrobiales bacterium]|jgi:acyl dehydratase|nr:MaoC family dehydratase N-terminal domain-containing protein [Hyphomicrobiales bacterium]
MSESRIPYGFTYDTIEVGQTAVSQGRTITETDINLYMMLTGGWHPVHCDKEFMRRNGLGPVRAQGSMGIALSLGSHLESSLVVSSEKFVRAIGVDQWAYHKPLVAGDTIHLEVSIADKTLMEDGRRYSVTRRVRIVNQDGVLIQEGLASSMWERDVPAGD